jgi:hypothetical protein
MTNTLIYRLSALAESNQAIQGAIDDLVLDEHINMATALGEEGTDAQIDFLRAVMSDRELLKALNLEI